MIKIYMYIYCIMFTYVRVYTQRWRIPQTVNNSISGNVGLEYLQIACLTEDFCLEYTI